MASFAVFSGLPSAWGVVGVTAVVLLVNGVGEETGWRGFLLPTLQARFSPLAAMGLLTLIWAGWHAPMFGLVSTFAGFTVATMARWLLGLAAGSVVMVQAVVLVGLELRARHRGLATVLGTGGPSTRDAGPSAHVPAAIPGGA